MADPCDYTGKAEAPVSVPASHVHRGFSGLVCPAENTRPADICGCHLGEENLLTSSGQRPGILLEALLQRTGHYWAPNINSALGQDLATPPFNSISASALVLLPVFCFPFEII